MSHSRMCPSSTSVTLCSCRVKFTLRNWLNIGLLLKSSFINVGKPSLKSSSIVWKSKPSRSDFALMLQTALVIVAGIVWLRAVPLGVKPVMSPSARMSQNRTYQSSVCPKVYVREAMAGTGLPSAPKGRLVSGCIKLRRVLWIAWS